MIYRITREDYNYPWIFQLSNNDNLPVSSEHSISSQSFTARGSSSGQSLDITKQDFTSQVSPGNAPTYGGPTTTYQSQKSSFQPSSGTPSTYNAYSTNSQSSQSTFQTAAANTNSYSATATVSQTSYNSSTSFPQSNASTFNQASPSASASATSGYNQPTTSSQVRITHFYLNRLIITMFSADKIVTFFLSIGLSICWWICTNNNIAVSSAIRGYQHSIE